MDIVDGRFGRVESLVGGLVDIVGWALVGIIHADAADEGALAVRVTEGGESVGCRDVDRCKVRGAGCAVGQSTSDDFIVHAQAFWWCGSGVGLLVLWVGFGAEAGFHGEGVLVQPVQET